MLDFSLSHALHLDDFLAVETAEETRAGYRNPDDSFRGLNDEGETLINLFSIPTLAFLRSL
jgi:hypothetical protein